MDLRQLEIFGAVMKTGTTVGAAHLLSISQPSVSNAIRRLEDRLGFDLFDRVQGRLQPTEEAKMLFRQAQDIFIAFDKTRQIVDDIRDDRRGAISVAATPVIGNSVLPRAIAAFIDSRPCVKVSLEIEKLDDVIEMVNLGKVDLGVAVNPYSLPTVITQPICTVRMVCVMHEDHPLSALSEISPVDLADQTLVSFGRDTVLGRQIETAFAKFGARRKINVEVRYCETACALARNRAGIAIVDQFVLNGSATFSSLVTRPFEPGIEAKACLLRPKFRRLSRLAHMFSKSLERQLAELETDLLPGAQREAG